MRVSKVKFFESMDQEGFQLGGGTILQMPYFSASGLIRRMY